MHVVAGTALPSNWHVCVASRHAPAVAANEAFAYICGNPWALPIELEWVACLVGAWIIHPSAYSGQQHGPFRKLQPALVTRRFVWVSDMWRSSHPLIWIAILESMHRASVCNWKLATSPEGWAYAKARNGKPSEAIALVDDTEFVDDKIHVFNSDGFLKFITKCDNSRTCIGN